MPRPGCDACRPFGEWFARLMALDIFQMAGLSFEIALHVSRRVEIGGAP
jgi:hypothetical protein